MSFSDLIGNDTVKETLIESIEKSNVIHSYMFYGTAGIGKKLFAIEYARNLLCESLDKACGKCKSCIEFESGNNPDFFYIEPDNGTIKIEQIREIQKRILEKPINGLKKIYIINDADKMTREAQNALLKTLEEPPEFIVIILVCSNENNILPTVKSRCTKIYFKELNDNEIKKYVEEKYPSTIMDENMIELCGGSISKINNIIEKKNILDNVKNLIDAVATCDEVDFLSNGIILYENRDDIDVLLEYMYLLLYKKVNDYSLMKCANSMNHVHEARKKLYLCNNYDMTIDSMLMKIWEEFNEKDSRSKI